MKRFAALAVLAAAAMVPLRAPASVDVLTYHNDTLRSGWNPNETALSPAMVSSGSFKQVFVQHIDGLSFTQPLIATGEKTSHGTHDLVVVGTERDSLYAFDAQSGRPVWRTSLATKLGGPVPDAFTGCTNQPTIGILSTPVIDRQLDTIFVVAATFEGPANGKHIHYRLHAIALGTGEDRQTPAEIAATLHGPAGSLPFLADYQSQRVALTEANGKIYVGFGSTCDFNENLYHGWIFAYDAKSLTQRAVFTTTKGHDRSGNFAGGIWESGNGFTIDPSGNLLVAVGNGFYDGRGSFGDSAIKLSPELRIMDWFTPDTVASDNANDSDFGSGGLMLLPPDGSQTPVAVAQGKDGVLTLLDQDHLGGYTPGGPDNALAELSLGGVWSSPAYFQGSQGAEYVFTTGGPLYAVGVHRHRGGLKVLAQTNEQYTMDNGNGATPSISSNGRSIATAVVWIVNWANRELSLYSYAANDLSKPLFTAPLGQWRYTNINNTMIPTVANGYVYIVSLYQLHAFSIAQ